MKALLPIALLAALAGCSTPQYAMRLEIAAVERVEENLEARRMIRAKCLEVFDARVAALESDLDGLAGYLRAQYPPLLTEIILEDLKADDPSLPVLPLVGCQ